MVYRRRRYRRYWRRRRYALSKFNLYKNSGSKSQAMQIYRVNKRLTRYQKRNKPKVRVKESTLNFNAANASQEAFGSITQDIIQDGEYNTCNLFRLHDITLSFLLTSEKRVQEIPLQGNIEVVMRINVFQYKQAHSNIDTAPWVIYPVTQENFQSNDLATRKAAAMQCVYGPLRSGVTAKMKVLRDFRLKYTTNGKGDASSKRCVIKYLRSLRKAPEKTYAAGTVIWCAVWWNNCVGAGINAKEIKFYIYSKVAFTTNK